ncbi:peptidoglycan bridge formation glycyltransferase FemA/FemB family protein [Patescibacteria group bacterium]|nr:peptidoglycan bridge formation glycyltransferase FemA/FemB family protein [Patescibacteria group bacterium]
MNLIFTQEHTDREGWNAFVAANGGDFLQSWEWGDLQKHEGSRVWRFWVSEGGERRAAFQARIQRTRIGNYLYIPHGPVFQSGYALDSAGQRRFVDFARTIDPASMFVLIEPLKLLDLASLPAGWNLQPPKTLHIDTSRDLDDIRRDMVKTRRQGIGYALKNGVTITHGRSQEFLDAFSGLIKRTASRQHFGIFESEHYAHILAALPSEIFVAFHEGAPVAAAQVVWWGQTVFYLHAGSDGGQKQLRAPDLLIWAIFEEAHRRGVKVFDFWGIDDTKWPGVTAFKRSFGGTEAVLAPGKVVVVHQLKYLFYKAYKRVKKVL